MTSTLSPRDVFLQLVHAVAERRLADLPPLYATNTHVEHPFAPGREPALRTREELREHFTRGLEANGHLSRTPVDITVHETADPEVIVAEFAYQETDAESGASWRVPCIFVLRVRDGEIVSSRDYIDHVGAAHARGYLDEVIDALRARAPRA